MVPRMKQLIMAGQPWYECSRCDQKLEQEWRFCPKCGKKVEWLKTELARLHNLCNKRCVVCGCTLIRVVGGAPVCSPNFLVGHDICRACVMEKCVDHDCDKCGYGPMENCELSVLKKMAMILEE